MNDFVVKGRCPDAWRPMMAGDGLIVRIKPRLSRLTRVQAAEVCKAADLYGNGVIDVTRRANLQIRGVSESRWLELVSALIAQGLVDADPLLEKARNILVAPDWRAGDDTHRIALELSHKLGALPDLPAKVGFVVDAGPAPRLCREAGDFRIERAQSGGLILRADGRQTGVELSPGTEADAAIAMATWFAQHCADTVRRMASYAGDLPKWAEGITPPASPASPIPPGPHDLGAAYGVAFGALSAKVFARLVASPSVTAVRLTPWRVIVVEGGLLTTTPGLILDRHDPRTRVEACPGAPLCPQATVDTRRLAEQLAPLVRGSLHVSGCAKGCACSRPTDITLTGREGRFDVAFNARAGERATCTSLEPAEALAHLGPASEGP